MRTITIRFWYRKSIVGDYTAYKLRWYNVDLSMYPKFVRPCGVGPYGVLVIFDDKDVVDFNDVVAMAMETAELGEILIGNTWFKLTRDSYVHSSAGMKVV